MKHLTSVSTLSRWDALHILEDARRHRAVLDPGPVGLVFHEPSTRTRFSFATAALRVGLTPIDLNVGSSSEQKGETALDTCRNLAWAGAKVLVLRTLQSGLPDEVSRHVGLPVVNAGDGTNEHPTQALGDALCLHEHFGRVDGLTVAIVGDVHNSRVARSNAILLTTLGARVHLVGSRVPDDLPGEHFTRTRSFERGLSGVDVVMVLRWQDERVTHPWGDKATYQVTEELLAEHAPTAKVMHPGPVNRGVELTEEVVDGPRSLIAKQVECGVAARSAVFRYLFE